MLGALKDKFEDYIAKDLMAEIDGKFRTLRDRHSRAIAGLSMSGYGALKIALRYHDDFAFAGSLSGALNAPQELGDKRPEFRDQLLKVFGPPGSTVRALRLAQMRASTVVEINHAAVLRLLISVRAAVNDCGILLSLSWLSRKLISPPTKMAKPEK